MFYVIKDLKTNLVPSLPKDLNCIIIDLTKSSIQLVNIYNVTHPNITNSLPMIQQNNILLNQILRKSIILGDFNTYHP